MIVFQGKNFDDYKEIVSQFADNYKENKNALRDIIESLHDEVGTIEKDVIKSSALILPNLLNPNLINSYLNSFIKECKAPCDYLINSSQQMIKKLVLEMV